MQCVEKGLLDLDADIASVLPELKDPQILTGFDGEDVPIFRPAKKAVTLRFVHACFCYVGYCSYLIY